MSFFRSLTFALAIEVLKGRGEERTALEERAKTRESDMLLWILGEVNCVEKWIEKMQLLRTVDVMDKSVLVPSNLY